MSDSVTATAYVLLVDDEASVRAMLQAVLESENYKVETAVSAADAQGKLDSRNYDLVITDMRMETEVSGYDVVRIARRNSPQPATLILTAFAIRESDWRAEGADAALMKPVPIMELLTTIQRITSTRVGAH